MRLTGDAITVEIFTEGVFPTEFECLSGCFPARSFGDDTRGIGIPDVVLDRQTGILVEEGDTLAMAVAMAELIDNPSLAAKLGYSGQKRSRKNFTLDCHVKQISALIHRLS